jgi:hypothetical protein
MAFRAKVPVPEDFEQSIFDRENPYSMINKLPEGWDVYLELAKNEVYRFYTKSDVEITNILKGKLSEREHRIRLSLWDEYYRVTDMGFQKMRAITIVRGASTTVEVFERHYANKPEVLAYFFTAPSSYIGTMKQILNEGQQRLLDIMRLPLQDENGKINTSVMNAVLKTFQLVDLRLKGSVVQRLQVDQRTFNANVDLSPEQVTNAQIEALKGMDLDQLEALERKINAAERIASKNIEALPADLKIHAAEVMNEIPMNKRMLPNPTSEIESSYIDYVESNPIE